MEKIIDLFGEKVKGKNGDVATKDLCGEKKLIGVYFSAHWCPPCRAFTPHLAKKYETWKKAGHPFEVIFVSSDRDQSNFDDYYKEMPWLTIPYDDEERRNKLSETFEVQGIPTLAIVCGNTGTVISEDASEDVGESDEFPKTWNTDPVNIIELIGDKVRGKDGAVDTSSFTGEGKVVGLYFSAHWCPPCRGFTPVLAKKYEEWKKAGANNFEIVFISSDRDEASFNDYYKEMPWLAMDFDKRDLKATCSSKFGVSGIPTLIILNGNTGEIIDKNGRSAVQSSETFPGAWNVK
ncbi:NXN [Mytilus coruscus]|uniref:protein-disulfide reductase n=1 Tax=Mytilus coruscus TaxID=42192 RepID=A0A6J8EPH3_MYTCO|nr:NXN [Mytilus coruscus]